MLLWMAESTSCALQLNFPHLKGQNSKRTKLIAEIHASKCHCTMEECLENAHDHICTIKSSV